MANKIDYKFSIPANPSVKRGQTCQLTASPDGTQLLYPAGNNIIIRNIEQPNNCTIYAEHGKPTTVARYSPNGQWVASADSCGKLKIWNPNQEESFTLTTKYEYMLLGGEIKDVAWDGESKRIAIAGDGRGSCANAIMFDTGSNVGDFTGIPKRLNSCDLRKQRPFRCVVGCDDFSSIFFQGPPFKFVKSNLDNTNYISCTRFSPDGSIYAASSIDGDITFYDGKDATKIFNIEKGHTGGIYAVDWNQNSSTLASASADKTVKLWDANTQQNVASICVGSTLNDQQLGLVWASSGQIISVSLDGTLNYIDQRSGKVGLQLRGHNSSIGSVQAMKNREILASGSTTGQLFRFNLESCLPENLENGHKAACTAVHEDRNGGFVSIGKDNTVRYGVTDYIEGKNTEFDSEPKVSHTHEGNLVIGSVNKAILVKDGTVKDEVELNFEPRAVAVFSGFCVIGGEGNGNVRLFDISGQKFKSCGDVNVDGGASALVFNSDGSILAAADCTNRAIRLFETDSWKVKASNFPHSARISCLAWSKDDKYIASGDIDQKISVWNTQAGKRKAVEKHAHRLTQVNSLSWVDDHTLVSASQDGNIKVWEANF